MTDLDIRSATPALRRRDAIAIVVRDPLLKMAIRSVVTEAGFTVAAGDDGICRLITDDHKRASPRTILFVDNSSSAARHAVQALTEGNLGGFVSKHDPESLLKALELLDSGMVAASSKVIYQAVNAPTLGWRQERIISMVIGGRPNTAIAIRLGLSEATVKREVSLLMRSFNVGSRVELAMCGVNAGYKAL